MTRRLLTIGHSYCVASNRRLAAALAHAGAGDWEVTVVAPTRFPGDFGPVTTAPAAGEPFELRTVPVRLAAVPHVMWYGGELAALLRERWDVVHCWEEPFVAAARQVARHVRDAALVYSTFQNIAKRYPPPFAAMERYAMSRAAGWIAFGRSGEEVLRTRAWYAARPHRVIPPGVDVPTPAAPAAREPVIGFLGRFVPAKGVAVLRKALESLEGDWRAEFVGDGPLAPALRAWAAQLPDGRVRVTPAVPHAAVPEVLARFGMLCVPSLTTRSWREQFGRVVVEAFAAGVPVIVSDSGELPTVAGSTAVVVPEGDARALAAAIARLMRDPAEREWRGRAGRARAATEFAWGTVGRAHLDFFDTLLRGRAEMTA